MDQDSKSNSHAPLTAKQACEALVAGKQARINDIAERIIRIILLSRSKSVTLIGCLDTDMHCNHTGRLASYESEDVKKAVLLLQKTGYVVETHKETKPIQESVLVTYTEEVPWYLKPFKKPKELKKQEWQETTTINIKTTIKLNCPCD